MAEIATVVAIFALGFGVRLVAVHSENVVSPNIAPERNSRDVMLDDDRATDALAKLEKYHYAPIEHVTIAISRKRRHRERTEDEKRYRDRNCDVDRTRTAPITTRG